MTHPLELLEIPERERAAVIAEMERELERWEAQQTSEQAAWRRRQRLRNYRGPLETARELVARGFV